MPLQLRIISKIALYVFRIAITVMPLAFICSGNVAHVTTFFFFQCAARQCFRRSLPAFYALFHNFCPFLPIPAHTPGRYAPAAFQLPEERRKRPRSEAARASLVTDQQRPPPMSAHVRTCLQISGSHEAPANYRQLAIFCISAAVYVSTGCIYKSLVIFMELWPKTV